MPLSSMTGFGRASGDYSAISWVWEVRSVNGRGLDVRLRLPAGWDALEAAVKALIVKKLARGSVNAALTLAQAATGALLRVNQPLLDQYLALSLSLARDHGLAPPTAADLLGLRGVVEGDSPADAQVQAAAQAELLAGLEAALDALLAARREEGARLAGLLSGLLDKVATHCAQAEGLAAAQPAMQQAKLTERLDELLAGRAGVDPDRLAQEVALLALKSDVREELDRLAGHVEAARALLASGEPAGRPFEFLVQEFNREANTLCSKSASPALTRCGLDLKALIDQLREQALNIE
jgi:uncharacterized protein (TIGR00255 family)